jgi:hypothetical protein
MIVLLIVILFMFTRVNITQAVGQDESPNRNEEINRLMNHYWLKLIDWPTASLQSEHIEPPRDQQPRSPRSQETEQKKQQGSGRGKKREYDAESYHEWKSDPVKVVEARLRRKVKYEEKLEKMTAEEREVERIKKLQINKRKVELRREKFKQQAEAASKNDVQAQEEIKRRRKMNVLAGKRYRERQKMVIKAGIKRKDIKTQARIEQLKEADHKRTKRYRDKKREEAKQRLN